MTLLFGLVIAVAALALVGGLLWVIGGLATFRFADLWSFGAVGAHLLASVVQPDRWREVFDTIRRNKLRTALTAWSVAWGIFVMVVLLGLGNGFNRGVRFSFQRESANSVFISANKTAIPYAGYKIGRRIAFSNSDYEAALRVAGVSHLSGKFFARSGRLGGTDLKTQRGSKSNTFPVNAVHPDAYYIGTTTMKAGRFLNATDQASLRKVAVIGRAVRNFLFERGDPIGQSIVIAGVAFQVVGVYSDSDSDEEERQIFIPISTAQLAFHGADQIGQLLFTVDGGAASSRQTTRQIKANLAAAHQFSPEDPGAVRVFDNVESSERFTRLFSTISIFIVVVGLGTLAAGVMGVSNIMMIAVKERTKEIGIRKALGATPQSIIAMIVQEAVMLTSIAGLFGLAAAVGCLSAIPAIIHSELIRNPAVDIRVGAAAAIGLVLAGAIAGYVPARAAARVNPIDSLRDQ